MSARSPVNSSFSYTFGKSVHNLFYIELIYFTLQNLLEDKTLEGVQSINTQINLDKVSLGF